MSAGAAEPWNKASQGHVGRTREPAVLASMPSLNEPVSIRQDRPAPLRHVGVPPASPLVGVRTLDDRMPWETGSLRPAGR